MSKLLTKSIIYITDISKDVIPLILEYYYDRKEVRECYNKVVEQYSRKVVIGFNYDTFITQNNGTHFQVMGRYLNGIPDKFINGILSSNYFHNYFHNYFKSYPYISNFLTGLDTSYELSPNYYHQKLFLNK